MTLLQGIKKWPLSGINFSGGFSDLFSMPPPTTTSLSIATATADLATILSTAPSLGPLGHLPTTGTGLETKPPYCCYHQHFPLFLVSWQRRSKRGGILRCKSSFPTIFALQKSSEEVNTSRNPQLCTIPSTSRLRDISDPLSWVFCFLSLVAAKISHQETRDLLAYGQIIIELARKHTGMGWYAYDSLFRQ